MVKKIVLITIIMPLLLIAGCDLLGLDDDKKADDTSGIYGTWVLTDGSYTETIVLKSDNTYSYSNSDSETDTGTFVYGDTHFAATSDNSSAYDFSGSYTLDGDLLILDGDTYIRQ